jgi:enoyl-CoA hydratase
MEDPEWRQLYVNAEHDGQVGVITISRESYNRDVDAELNRAVEWLKAEGVERVIVTGDFHLSTQMVGADTSEFFPALDSEEEGVRISASWSRTARRLSEDFAVSVGFIPGKRCLGGFLELMTHCHYVLCLDDTQLGLPEVTLPVVPGMEGCHWPFRKCAPSGWEKLFQLALTGRPVRGRDAVGWLVDHAGPMDDALSRVWQIVTDGDHGLARRELDRGAMPNVAQSVPELAVAGSPGSEAARSAILATIRESCAVPINEALDVQARHSAGFMRSDACRRGMIGQERDRTRV